jgi:uncharacterized protein (UPF0147 family)
MQAKPAAWSSPAMAAALLALLAREHDVVTTTLRESNGAIGVSDKYGEGFGEYESDVFEACLQYCEKQGLLSLMLRNTRSGTKDQADAVALLRVVRDRGFSVQQRTAIDSALIAAASEKRSFLVREAGVAALANAVKADRALPANRRAKIHSVVAAATMDSAPNVRLRAVNELGDIGTPADVPLLTRLAQQDTSRETKAGRIAYPVRDGAARAIAKITPK